MAPRTVQQVRRASTGKGAYAPSEKRETTRAQNREKIEAAAWTIFSTIGLDATSVRDIVAESQVSPGSFYNYYGSKEAVFDKIVDRLIRRIREETAAARAGAGDLEVMLFEAYLAFMNLILPMKGGAAFFELNQHHIRSRLFGAAQIEAMLSDIETDVGARIEIDRLPTIKRHILISVLFASGTEAIFAAFRSGGCEASDLARFLTQLFTHGIASTVNPMSQNP